MLSFFAELQKQTNVALAFWSSQHNDGHEQWWARAHTWWYMNGAWVKNVSAFILLAIKRMGTVCSVRCWPTGRPVRQCLRQCYILHSTHHSRFHWSILNWSLAYLYSSYIVIKYETCCRAYKMLSAWFLLHRHIGPMYGVRRSSVYTVDVKRKNMLMSKYVAGNKLWFHAAIQSVHWLKCKSVLSTDAGCNMASKCVQCSVHALLRNGRTSRPR